MNISSCVGRQQHVGALAVLQAEHVVAVVGPAPGQLVRLAGQQRREVHLLEAGPVHLLADDPLDVAVHDPAERQPGEPARRGAADVAGANQQAVAGDLGVGRVLAQRTQEHRRHSEHSGYLGG